LYELTAVAVLVLELLDHAGEARIADAPEGHQLVAAVLRRRVARGARRGAAELGHAEVILVLFVGVAKAQRADVVLHGGGEHHRLDDRPAGHDRPRALVHRVGDAE